MMKNNIDNLYKSKNFPLIIISLFIVIHISQEKLGDYQPMSNIEICSSTALRDLLLMKGRYVSIFSISKHKAWKNSFTIPLYTKTGKKN